MNVSKLDVSRISKFDISRSRADVSRNDVSRDGDQSIFNLRNLRKFDKQSGGYREKEFTEEYGIDKAENFLHKSATLKPKI